MSTPEFGVPTLERFVSDGYQVVGVVCQPDKPLGRGLQVSAPAIKRHAMALGVPVLQPSSLKKPDVHAELAELRPDLILVAAYGKFIPDEIVALPPRGCINLHPSLLPRWRGACPVHAAILAGDAEAGVTIHFVTDKMDSGDILAQDRAAIRPDDNAETLTARLAGMGAETFARAIGGWLRGEITPRSQDDSQATWCDRMTKANGRIEWNRPAVELERQVRAFCPWPGAYTTWQGRQLNVREARVVPDRQALATPGLVLAVGDDLLVATPSGALRLVRVQLAGRREQGANEFAGRAVLWDPFWEARPRVALAVKEEVLNSLYEDLQAICGPEYVSEKLVDRICHTRDAGPTPGGVPAVVVRPRSTEHVRQILSVANAHETPIFIWGRSSTFIGHGIQTGCILMALDLMNKIEKMDFDNQAVTVEAGAIWHAVDVELGKHGWELAVPGSGGMFVCTVGGSVAYNSVPHGMCEYGMTGDNVIALQVVLPNGQVVYTGSAANRTAGGLAFERNTNGPDLAGLFIGSCGVYGVITNVTYRIRRKPDAERFAFYAFDSIDTTVDAAQALQRRAVPTHMIGVFGGPKPTGAEGEGFLHIVIRDGAAAADERLTMAHAICSGLNGVRQDQGATQRYWTNHMYSWLRNTPPEVYYGDRPYTCPEAAAFMPTQKIKEALRYLQSYEVEHAEEFAKHGIRIKCYDVYFSRNAGFLWIDTLYPELDAEAWKYGLKIRADYSEHLYSHFASPGGILAPLAQHIMPKLGDGFELMRALKQQLDPKGILNPGILMLGTDGTKGQS